MLLKISGCSVRLLKNKSVRSVLTTIYGVGRVRAKKISDLLLNHPAAKKFKNDLVTLSQDNWVQRLFKSFDNDNQLRMSIFSDLERKAEIKCYSARRILMNLPSRGQRTHTNAGTPKRLNPFITLGVKNSYAQELIENNKKWELNWNGRSDDLVDLSKARRKKFSSAAHKQKQQKTTKKKK